MFILTTVFFILTIVLVKNRKVYIYIYTVGSGAIGKKPSSIWVTRVVREAGVREDAKT